VIDAAVRAGEPLANDGLSQLLDKLARDGDVRCEGYKPSCLRRRLGVRVRATGAGDLWRYAAVLDAQPAEWRALRDALTVNVTGFFRDAEVFAQLRERVLPALSAQVDGVVRAWSAGCSSGEEPWALAMLLAECAGEERTAVLATDIDERSLARARDAEYAAQAVASVPASLRARWLPDTEPARIVPALRRCVTVQRHDLLCEPAPASGLHLVTCRNVVIYFTRAAKEALYQRFADALAPGGVLVLGKSELLTGPARRRFESIAARERIYRRLA
jgi:chemotaxis methyl-accepting protein methylase